MVRDDVRRVDGTVRWAAVGPRDDEIQCVASCVCRLRDGLLHVECGQQLGQTVGVTVRRVVDVHVEVAGDDHLTTKRGDDFQQFRQLIKEPLRLGFTTTTINDDVNDIQ